MFFTYTYVSDYSDDPAARSGTLIVDHLPVGKIISFICTGPVREGIALILRRGGIPP
jgi:hypothetical protein